MGICVFIGPSYKNIKFSSFLCRIIKKVFNCFFSTGKTFSNGKKGLYEQSLDSKSLNSVFGAGEKL